MLGRIARQATRCLLCALALAAPAAAWRKRAPPAPAPTPASQFFECVEARDVRGALRHAPAAYARWWRRLVRDEPHHVAVETVLVAFLAYLVLTGRKKQDKTPAREKLTEKEVDALAAEWAPAPLVPPPSAAARALASKRRVVSAADRHGRVTVVPDAATAAWAGGVPRGATTALNCGAFDFLGMAAEKAVRDAAAAALSKYGCGSCGPRGFYGSIDVHERLEEAVAAFCGTEQAIAFSDAASCCTSTVAAFAKRGDLLLVDDGVCEPLRTGCVLSRARVVCFKHNDMADLRRVMDAVAADDIRKKRPPGTQRRFVVCEAVSRDHGGDVAPLPELVALKNDYGYRLVLDESLSMGVLGATGRGLREVFDIRREDVEVTTVDLAPALGSLGGLCVGSREVVAHQRLSGAGYCFSAAAPPFYSAAALASLGVIEERGPAKLAALRRNAAALRRGLEALADGPLELAAGGADVPFALLRLRTPGEDPAASLKVLAAVADAVLAKGYVVATAVHGETSTGSSVKPFRPKPPALRVCVTCAQTAEEVAGLVEAVVSAAKGV